MRLLALAPLLLALACGSKNDDKKDDQPATKPATTAPAKTPEKPKPEPPEKKPAFANDAKLDCDALLTAADIEKECKTKVGEWKADAMETKEGPAYCSRRAGPNGAFVRLMVGIYPHTSAAALVTKNASATKPVLEKKRAGKAQLEVAHARVENVAVSVRSQYIGGKKPACTSEQLGKLATIASSRVR